MPPTPLTPAQKRLMIGFGILGILLLLVGIYVSGMDNVPTIVKGGLFGAAGSLIAISGISLIHPPDR